MTIKSEVSISDIRELERLIREKPELIRNGFQKTQIQAILDKWFHVKGNTQKIDGNRLKQSIPYRLFKLNKIITDLHYGVFDEDFKYAWEDYNYDSYHMFYFREYLLENNYSLWITGVELNDK